MVRNFEAWMLWCRAEEEKSGQGQEKPTNELTRCLDNKTQDRSDDSSICVEGVEGLYGEGDGDGKSESESEGDEAEGEGDNEEFEDPDCYGEELVDECDRGGEEVIGTGKVSLVLLEPTKDVVVTSDTWQLRLTGVALPLGTTLASAANEYERGWGELKASASTKMQGIRSKLAKHGHTAKHDPVLFTTTEGKTARTAKLHGSADIPTNPHPLDPKPPVDGIPKITQQDPPNPLQKDESPDRPQARQA
ncbi:hypothetical protein FRC07_012065 [Ceratobasidium sp. 392]|nr:hypothetical protein FRC07_012065 [Ceratobasidium sp. 392]